MSWVAQYIGQEWIPGENDCWSFFRKVQRNHFNREVPEIDVDALNRLASVRMFEGSEERANWQQIAVPADGDAVLMYRGSHPSHIGVWVDGRVLHSVKGKGVIYQPRHIIERNGWRMEFYRHA